MLLLVYHKHTQWPGPGRTEQNVVGYPMLPVYAAKAGGFFFIVFGVTALMGGLLSINPVWKFGPYDPSKVTAGSQPDWYMGWPDGALRIMPNWETHIFGPHDLLERPAADPSCCPVLMFTVLLLLPFLEAWITGDKREHHLLQRPRNAPTRTAFMVALMTIYGLVLGGRRQRHHRHQAAPVSLNQITYFMRVAVFIGPVIAFLITRRWCISLQRKDNDDAAARLRDRHHHALARGRLRRAAPAALARRRAYALTARDRDPEVLDELDGGPDANGVEPRSGIAARLAGVRHRLRDADVRRQRAEADRCGARGGPPPRRARARAPGAAGGPRGRRPPVRRPPLGRGREAPRRRLTARSTTPRPAPRWRRASVSLRVRQRRRLTAR